MKVRAKQFYLEDNITHIFILWKQDYQVSLVQKDYPVQMVQKVRKEKLE